MKLSAPIACVCAVLTAGILLSAGCGKKAPTNVLAHVGSEVITVEDFQAELQRRGANRQAVLPREQLLNEMVARLTLVQRAKNSGLEKADDVRRTVEEVLIAKLKEKELEPQLAAVTVSTNEIRAAYEKDAARFTTPAKTHLAIIFIAADTKAGTNRLAELSARAREARQAALALPATEKGFGNVAAGFSDDQISRYRGGEAGWFTSDELFDRWPKPVITAGLALKEVGSISAVLATAEGFYLVKKMDERAAVVSPLAQVSGGIHRQLLTAKLDVVEKNFQASLRTAANVQTDLILLGTISYPTQTVANAMSIAPPAMLHSP